MWGSGSLPYVASHVLNETQETQVIHMLALEPIHVQSIAQLLSAGVHLMPRQQVYSQVYSLVLAAATLTCRMFDLRQPELEAAGLGTAEAQAQACAEAVAAAEPLMSLAGQIARTEVAKGAT